MLQRSIRTFSIMLIMCLASFAQAHEYYAGNFKLIHPWSQASEAGDTEASVYFAVEDIARGDVLLRVDSSLGESVEFRSGQGAQVKVLESINIVAGSRQEFLPGETYVVIKGLKTPLQWARSYAMTFVFKHAGPVNVMVSVGSH
jgi:periplasmic copper chaperone A